MVTYSESSFVNGRGQKIHSVALLPDGPPKAAITFHHGIGEYIHRSKPCKPKQAESMRYGA
jgi:hypothetical protein